MPVIDENGVREDCGREWREPDALGEGDSLSVALANDADPAALASDFPRLALIAVEFPSFADGRGFTLGQRLRAHGYRGRLRARGHVIADQARLARRCGFDEIEIEPALYARQPWPMWRAGFDMMETPFRARLSGRAAVAA
jgi:uncharacterized protein (DUF934 family)